MDTVLFLVGKLVGFLLRAETWLVLLALLGVVAQARGRARLGLWAGSALLAVLVGLTVLPIGGLVLRPLEAAYPAEPPLAEVAGVIVLGGSEDVPVSRQWGGVQLRASGERLAAGAELARRFPGARVLLLGGGGALRDLGGPAVSEASIAAEFMRRHGVAEARLTLEERSRNTAENAARGLAQVEARPGEVWVLVTSAYHMPRAIRSFAAAGWPEVVAYPVDFRSVPVGAGIGWNLPENMELLNIAIREWVGGVAYRLTGR